MVTWRVSYGGAMAVMAENNGFFCFSFCAVGVGLTRPNPTRYYVRKRSPPMQHSTECSPPTRPRATPRTQLQPHTQNAAQQRRPRVPPARPSSDKHRRTTPRRRRAPAGDPAKATSHRPCTCMNGGERCGASLVVH